MNTALPPERHAWRSFYQLTTGELYEILRLRSKVFVVEQQCAYLDIDGNDQRADHLLAWDAADALSGYLRAFAPDNPDAAARIGRVVTSPEHRGAGLGHWLMQEALSFIAQRYGRAKVELSAQAHLEQFYAGFGFTRTSENYLEDGIPHCRMQRQPFRDMPNTHDVVFRSYALSDFEAVAALWTRVNRELAPAGMEARFEQYIATTIEGELSHLLEIFSLARRNAFWVVQPTDGSRRIAGTFGIECHDSETTELRRMYIDAEWRGRGLAQRMLHAAEDKARELGFSRMIVSTADIQRAAFRFYTKSGFERIRSEVAETMTVKQAGGGLLRHYFEKPL